MKAFLSFLPKAHQWKGTISLWWNKAVAPWKISSDKERQQLVWWRNGLQVSRNFKPVALSVGPCDVTSHPGEKQYLSYSHDKKLRTEFTLLFYPFQGNLVHSSIIPHHWIGWASCDWQLSTPVAKLGTVVYVSVPSCKPTLQTGRSAGDIWHGKRKGGSVFDIKVYNCGKKVVIGRNRLRNNEYLCC